MALMKKSALSVVMMVALVATSLLQLHASVDFPKQEVAYSSGGIESEEACCDKCDCALAFPPLCSCSDIKPSCHPSCKLCICTKSTPPQCRCSDFKDHCDKKCSSAYSLL